MPDSLETSLTVTEQPGIEIPAVTDTVSHTDTPHVVRKAYSEIPLLLKNAEDVSGMPARPMLIMKVLGRPSDSTYKELEVSEKETMSRTISEKPWLEGRPPVTRPHDYVATSVVIVTLTVVFCIVASNFSKFVKLIKGYVEELRNPRSRGNVFDEPTVNERSLSLVLTIGFVICAGVLLFCAISGKGVHVSDKDLPVIGINIGVVTVYYIFQGVAYRTVGYAFSTDEMSGKWLRVFVATQNLTGVGILIPTLLAIFYPDISELMCLVALGIYLMCHLLFVWRGFRIFYYNFYSLVYFILYLCSLEILPPIFLYNCAQLIDKVIVW